MFSNHKKALDHAAGGLPKKERATLDLLKKLGTSAELQLE